MSGFFPLAGNAALRQQLGDGTRLSHAYILSGEVGSGRHTLARHLAMTLLCSGPVHQRPCTHCSNCRKVAEGIHPDLITVGGEGDILVEDARKMRSDAYIRPNEAERKVYLIENADSMNEKAQNAVLKLIEDGPDYAAFLFLTHHAGQLLQTIRSRCEELKLTPVPYSECVSYLTDRFPDKTQEEIQAAAQHCQGILGEGVAALSGSKPDNSQALEWAEGFCLALAQRDELSLGAFLAAHDKNTRDELSAFCRQAQERIHQALRHQTGVSHAEGSALTLAQRCSPSQLLACHDLLETTLRGFEGNAGAGHSLGWLIVSCLSVF
jgi:DNA polymerase-3 subunit delta'